MNCFFKASFKTFRNTTLLIDRSWYFCCSLQRWTSSDSKCLVHLYAHPSSATKVVSAATKPIKGLGSSQTTDSRPPTLCRCFASEVKGHLNLQVDMVMKPHSCSRNSFFLDESWRVRTHHTTAYIVIACGSGGQSCLPNDNSWGMTSSGLLQPEKFELIEIGNRNLDGILCLVTPRTS